MKVLIISQYFWPENFRINDLCAELARRNHHVTVLTGKPNYPDGSIDPAFLQNPSEFARYANSRIIRVPMIPRGQGSKLKLLANYITFALSASLWGWIKLRKLNFDVIFVYEPSPVTVGLPAIFLKKIKRIPVVFWALDLWPDSLEAVGAVKSGLILNLVAKLVSFIYNRCDLVLGQSKAFLEGIAQHCDNPEKIKYFPSWAEDIFSNPRVQPRTEIVKFNDVFKVLFAGNVGEAQDFPSLIAAAELLKKNKANVKLFVVGDGRMFASVKQQVEEKHLENYVYLFGRYPLETMPEFYASVDAMLVSLKENRIFSMTIPGKLQTYMMAGKPILAMIDGEGALVVNEANAGYTCNAGDYNGLAENIITMSRLHKEKLRELGVNARKFAQTEFERDRLISQLERWFSEVVGAGQRNGITQ